MIACIFFDVDDTLMDYRAAELALLRRLFVENGLAPEPDALELCYQKSWEYWDAHGLSETWREDVQRDYHARYKRSVTAYCADMRARFGFSASAEALYDAFCRLMGQAVTPYADTLPTLHALEGHFVRCIASNTLAASQRARLSALGVRFDHLFLSEEMGCIKPSRAFFDRAVARTGFDAAQCLMVGDSLTGDIAGAANAGLHTCWLNRTGRAPNGVCRPDYTIKSLAELLEIDKIKGRIQV